MTTRDRPSQTALLNALRQKDRELDVLRRISETVSGTLDQEAVLERIIELVVEVTRGDAAFLYLLDDAREALVLRASSSR
jgi:GAF domain-containing protein